MSVATERRAQFRGRTESDAQPVTALQSAETILAVAEAAGSRHREALAASQTVVESMASVLRGEQSSFIAAHSSVTDLVKAHVTLASDAAAAKARAAYAEAALAASVQHRETAPQVPSVFSEPDLAARLLSTAAADVTRQASRASAAETFAATAKVTHTGLSRALEVSTALQQQCSALRQRLALAESKCLASESANNNHEFEVIGLLRAVERLSSLCADADGLRSENQRMKGYLRNLEALLTPAQIMSAALPSDYKPPASFRVFSGAVPIVLKKEVPALFALRRMDEKELTLTDVLHEWISIGDQVGLLRDELASTAERANRDAARIAELEVEVVDERTRRVGAESHLKQVLSSRIDASTARHEMDQALYRLSLALDEKVALAATVARLTQQRDLALEEKAKLQGKLDDAEARLANRNAISDEVTSLRLGYSRSLEALRGQIATIAAAANLSKQETETLTTRLVATEKTLVAVSKEGEAVKQRLQTAERELDEATRRLTAESKRNAELERVCANASAAKLQQAKASSVQPTARTSQVLSTGLTTLHVDAAKLEAELRTISTTIASVATLFATPPQTNVAAMQEALLLSAKVVDSTLRSAEQLRADVAERAVSDARRIDALTEELNASVRETHDLRKQLAETEAWAERAAVHVTETITGRSVPIEDARCAFCDLRANEAASDRAKAAEALSVAASMEQAVAQTEAAHAEAVAALQLKDIQIAALQRQVEWTTARVAHARQEAERLHLVRVELQRSLALTNETSPANDDEVADVTEPVAPQVSDELRGILELLTGAVDQARQTTSQLLGTDQPRDDSNGEVQASNDEDAVQDAANETTSASRRNLSLIVKTLWEAAYATRSAGSDAPATQTAPNSANESATAENAALHERVKSLESQVEAANKTVEVQNKLIQHYSKTQAASPAAPAAVPAGPTQQELDAEKAKVASLEEKVALQTRLVDLLKHKIAALTEPKPAPQQPAQPAPQQ